MIKSHEEHQSLVSSCINEIHCEFDKILRVVVEDRSYGLKKDSTGNAQNVDLPHIRRLFESLLNALSVLQNETNELNVSGNKKKLNKALSAFPCGFLNIEEVVSVALRLLRINSSTSPKQVRADKRSYDDLMQVYLQDLHCLAWKIISFLFKNVEMGTEIFERELAALTRDQIKSDLKSIEKLGQSSERALDQFNNLVKNSSLFSGQVFVDEIVRCGILLEISTKSTQKFSSLLRSGGIERENSSANNKKARYHQITESDQKRLENTQKSFCLELEESFKSLSRNFIVFESAYGHLSPQEHISLTENLLNAIVVLFQSQHNFKFVPEIIEGEYLRILVDYLSFALVSFQPAYLPPFLPISIRILGVIASKSDPSGLSARRALLKVELMIHPRRLGPVTFRPASDSITRVFERPEPIIETKEVPVPMATEPILVEVSNEFSAVSETPMVAAKGVTEIAKPVQQEISAVNVAKVESEPMTVNQENSTGKYTEEIPMSTSNTLTQPKRSFNQVNSINNSNNIDGEDEEDDMPLPQIVDSGPDDN